VVVVVVVIEVGSEQFPCIHSTKRPMAIGDKVGDGIVAFGIVKVTILNNIGTSISIVLGTKTIAHFHGC
jgi:hypothetical protein